MDGPLWTYVLIGLMLSVVASIGGLAVVGLLLVRIPADYFCDHSPRDFWVHRHPYIRWAGLILKNLLGAALVGLGVLLSLPGVPGPGILTILIGLMLLDFPGKRDLERRLIGRPTIARSINRLRRRYGKSPLEWPDSTQSLRPPDGPIGPVPRSAQRGNVGYAPRRVQHRPQERSDQH